MEKIKGIIYKYLSPSNKVYIGQTLNEERRKKEFKKLTSVYSGLKLENARKKYGLENFKYEVLFQKEYDDIESAITELNEKEIEFIHKYNSINNGYNTSSGGYSLRDIMLDLTCKKRMIESLKKYYQTHENPFKGKKHTKETLEKIQETRKKLVAQIDINTSNIINIYSSLSKAAFAVNKSKYTDIIKHVCEGYISPLTKKKYETAYGYKWKFINKDEGSTTIEKALLDNETK